MQRRELGRSMLQVLGGPTDSVYAMSADAPTVPVVRRALTSDLPRLGRLGALLVQTHHDLDPRRFLAATPRSAPDYAAFLGTEPVENH